MSLLESWNWCFFLSPWMLKIFEEDIWFRLPNWDIVSSVPVSLLSYSVLLCVAGQAYWREGGRGWASNPIIQLRESMAFYKSFNTLWLYPLPSHLLYPLAPGHHTFFISNYSQAPTPILPTSLPSKSVKKIVEKKKVYVIIKYLSMNLSPNFKTFLEPRNRLQGINSASLCSLAGRYNNPIPSRFLIPIDCLKIPAHRLEIL